jgi:uncharacterized protein (DUF1800 family)
MTRRIPILLVKGAAALACFVLGMAFCGLELAQAQAVAGPAIDTEQEAAHVLNRMAFGPRPGDLERVEHMGINRYIDEQLYPERIAMPADLTARLANLSLSNATAGQLQGEFRATQKMARQDGDAGKEKRKELLRELGEQSADARLSLAVDSPRQLEEVLVDFWFNHFNVFAGKGIDRVLVSNYEREAIRPYVLGHFRDLLVATAHHPAMLFYLDNWLSTAPGFQPQGGGQGKASGLNENYARELMELHTLGVDAGYSQKDVTELARILTGWTFDTKDTEDQSVFRFDMRRHDWGQKVWLGYQVAPRGQSEGDWALDVLAASPKTAHHISYQLAQYFVADNPPEALVQRMTDRYMATSGDLRAVMYVLLKSREFQIDAMNQPKFKTPFEFVVSTLRASGLQVTNPRPLQGVLNQLGEPLYGCQTPDGYKNTEQAWLNPDALTRRIGFATVVASGRLPGNANNPGNQNRVARVGFEGATPIYAPANAPPLAPLDAGALLQTLGPVISTHTRDTIAANDPKLQAALVLGSPDFMNR